MKALRKEFWMEIKKSKSRFISILLIVALGVAFFSGIQASSPDMRYSGDAYYDENNLMDIKVVGTMGLTADDVSSIEEVDGIESAEGAWSTDVTCGEGQKQKVLHIESLNHNVNKLSVQEGHLPEKSGEIFLDSTFATSNEYKVGDKVILREGGDNSLLVTTEYTIVGIGRSPLYISFNRGNSTLGTGEVNGFGYVLPADFDQELYTQIYVTVHGAKELTSYTDGYENLIARITERVESIADQRCEIRLADVKADAQEEINDAQKKLDDGKKEADEKLADAKEELDKGEKELEDGKKEYEDGKSQLADAKSEIEDGRQQLADGKKQLADGRSQLEAAKEELNSSKTKLDNARSQLDTGWNEVDLAKARLSDGVSQLEDAQKKVDSGLAELEANQQKIDENAAKLADGKAQLEAGEQQLEAAKQELTARQSELDQSKAQLTEGQQQLESTKTQLNEQRQQITDGLAQVAEGEAKLQEGETALESGKTQLSGLQSQLEAVRGQYNAALENPGVSQEELDALASQITVMENQEAALSEQLQASEVQLEEQRSQLSASRSQLETSLGAVEEGFSQLSQKETELNTGLSQITEGQAQIDAGWVQLQEQEKILAASRTELEAGEQELAEGQKQLKKARKKLNKAQKEIDSNAKTLEDGQAELDANIAKLNESEQQYASGLAQYNSGAGQIAENEEKLVSSEQEIIENEKKLKDGEKEIADNEKKLEDAANDLKKGEEELADGKKKYQDSQKEAEDEIARNQQKLDDAKGELEKLEMPEWMVTDREDLPEYSDYGDNADRLRNIGQVFPVIFFLVAALISLTTMTRMVEEQRTQIGTLKALGYKKNSIAAKYICYAFLATVLGCILGMLIGEKIIPYVIITAYGIMYHNVSNSIYIEYQFSFALIASCASIVCTVGATFFACGKELQETPASLMRPPAPKEGKRVLLERITFIWKHLSFSWKSTIRNLFRYKKRLVMTIFGIAGSMGLMLVGFGIQDSVSDIATIQYRDLQHYEGMIIEDSDATEEEREELQEYMKGNEKIAHCNRVQMTKISAPKGGTSISVYLFVPEKLDEFAKDVTLQNRITKEKYELTDEGAAISEKTSRLLGLKVGDNITLEKADKQYTVRVAVITENYMSHYLYMTPAVYEQTFGEEPDYQDIVFTLKDEYKDASDSVGTEILTYPGALSISYTSSLSAQVDRMLSTLDVVILVLIVSAGLLAFVVLYNLNNINITERQRELATLKVLGFYDGEVSQYVLRENVILTALGILFGAVFGILLHRYVITTVEVDAVMFGRNIKPLSFLYSGVLTSVFSVVVNGVMHFKLKAIDMVESLKSVE